MKLKYCFSALFIIFYFFSSFSQTNGHLIEQSLGIKVPFTITQYSTREGLPQSQVAEIEVKKNGHLIISTANGIVEFNGVSFKSMKISDECKKHIFTKLFWVDDSQTLIGTETGASLSQIYPSFIETIFKAPFVVNDSLFCISEMGDIYYSKTNNLKYKKLFASTIKNAKCMCFKSPNFYIGSSEGLYKYNLLKNETTKLLKGEFLSLLINPFNNLVYAVGSNEIFKINKEPVKVFEIENRNVLCKDIAFIDSSEFFVATTKGLYQVGKGYKDLYTKKNTLPSEYIECLYYNKQENCLFVGTGEKGLLRLQLKNCYSFAEAQGFKTASSISSIIKTTSNDVLVSEYCCNIYKIGVDTIYPYTDVTSGYASLAEIDSVIFAGTWGNGVKLIKNKKLIGQLSYPNNLPDPNVHGVFKDSKGGIWISTNNGIAWGAKSEEIKPLHPKRITDLIVVFYELKNNNVCIGGSNGVFILDQNKNIITKLDKSNGLVAKEIRSFYEDTEGKLWIGTYDGGLYCYYKNNLVQINSMKNAMLDKDAFCLAKDSFGYLFITSNHGLWRINENDLNNFYYKKTDYLVPFFYGEETGILNTEFNGGFQNNYLKTKQNHFYFPTIQGLVIVTPEQPVFRKLNIVLDKILVNDTFSSVNQTVFNRNVYSLQFDFSCISFVSKYNVYYQYKIVHDNETAQWSALQKNQSVSFKLLVPGKYTFVIRAIDAFNDPNPTEIKYKFEILPYFYETFWFKVILLLLIISVVSTFTRYRIQIFRRKGIEKERQKRQLAELELKVLQSQMNPHFIFNCLNSIKYFISIHDDKNANDFIDYFSVLLRKFIGYSESSFITIDEEAKVLESYLELEKRRSDPPFTTILQIPEELFQIKIPTFLIQPFVENAIKHGIFNSFEKCHLQIIFKIEINNLICIIDDTGIGRKKSNEINRKKNYHVSKGLNLINDKIQSIKEVYNIDIKILIEDKEDTQGNSLGTKVILQIPLKR